VTGPEAPGETAVIMICPDGPLIVRGAYTLVDSNGGPIPGARRTTALCRCGRSREKPFCDGSHKMTGFRAP